MTQALSEAEKDKVVSLLAQYLGGRSEVFQNKVYELVIQYGWDVNDPAFAILLATGQMETILESFPEQFEALFLRLMQESQQAFTQYQQWSKSRQTELREYIQGLEVQQSQSIDKLNENIGIFSKSVEAQRQSDLAAIDKIMAVAKERCAELLEELRVELKPMQKEFTVSASSYARELVSDSLIFWNKKAIREAALGGAILGFVFLPSGFLRVFRLIGLSLTLSPIVLGPSCSGSGIKPVMRPALRRIRQPAIFTLFHPRISRVYSSFRYTLSLRMVKVPDSSQ